MTSLLIHDEIRTVARKAKGNDGAKAKRHCFRTGEYGLTTLLARGATPANENGGFPDLYNKAADERRPTVVLENQNPV
jgi:hypothetical protein